MDNSINFKGAFWLKQPSNSIQRRIVKNLGPNNQIIRNLGSEGDILYITEKSADKRVAKFLTNHRLTKFKYYPELDTKSGFYSDMPAKEAMEILSNYKNKVISKVAELKNIFKLNNFKYRISTRKRDNTIEKCLQTLDLNLKDYDIKKLDGFSEIYTKDTDKKLVGIISEPGQYGFRYARIEPQAPGDTVKRYAVKPGEKFIYVNNPDNKIEDATTTFMINYMKAVNKNKVTHNAAHQ